MTKRILQRNSESRGVYLSPVSLSALKNFYHPYGLMTIANRYSVRRFSTVARIGGAGYRQTAKIHWSSSIKRILGLFQKGQLPVDLWLGRGLPLNPYLRATLIHKIRERIKPVSLRVPPDGYFVTSNVKVFL